MFRAAGSRLPGNRAWPPPPHDPRERLVVSGAGPWQVRIFAPTDPKLDYFARRGLWHLQLWHPGAGISILSPSGLTSHQYEIFPGARGWKQRARNYQELATVIRLHHGVTLPSEGTLAVLQAWFVEEQVLRVLGEESVSTIPSSRLVSLEPRVHGGPESDKQHPVEWKPGAKTLGRPGS